MLEFIKEEIKTSIDTKKLILEDESLLENLKNVANLCVNAYKNGNKTILAGNGGSAADAQHISAEFVGRYAFDRPSLPSISLSTDTSIITAIANDYGYENLFARQIQGQGVKGDIFIAISTSGNSKNILKALEVCKDKGIVSIGLVGSKPCAMDELCDYILKVPSKITPRIQESHILIGHIICSIVENTLFKK